MSKWLSNTAVPRYYGEFRDKVLAGEIPVNREISMEMNRIDELIQNPGVYYDPAPVEGWIAYCESELVLTDGSDFKMMDSFNYGVNNSMVGSTLRRGVCIFQILKVKVDDTYSKLKRDYS